MTLTFPAPEYARFLAALKERIRGARAVAALSVNRELISLYWDIGKAIAEKRAAAGWGDAVVEKLSRDLIRAFPGVRGFSAQNLWRMQQFYLAHSSPEFLSHAVRELRIKRGGEKLSQAVRELLAAVPWGHHANALARVSDPAARLYYLRAIAKFGWSRDILLNQIKAQAYERAVKERKTHNFSLAIPGAMAERADEMLKSRYNLEFLGIGQAIREYNLLNEKERAPDDAPSIGIILCAEKEDVEVEFALKTKTNPIGVAEYQLQPRLPAQLKGRLPSARQLAAVFREAVPART